MPGWCAIAPARRRAGEQSVKSASDRRPRRERGRHRGPMIQRVSRLVAAVVGAALGVLGTLLGVTLWRARDRSTAASEPRPLLSHQLRITIEHLRGAAAVLGPHDELLVASMGADSSGVIRGSRIATADVLELVREARRSEEPGVLNLDVATGLGIPA